MGPAAESRGAGGGGRARLLAAAVALLAVALACALLSAAAGSGVVGVPDVDVGLGGARLVGTTSVIRRCTQLVAVECTLGNPARRVYTLWLFIRTDPRSWESPQITRLLTLPLGFGSRRS